MQFLTFADFVGLLSGVIRVGSAAMSVVFRTSTKPTRSISRSVLERGGTGLRPLERFVWIANLTSDNTWIAIKFNEVIPMR